MSFLRKNKALVRLFAFFLFFLVNTPQAQSELPQAGGLSFSPSDVVIWHGEQATSYEDSYTAVRISLETKENFGLYASKLKIYPLKDLSSPI